MNLDKNEIRQILLKILKSMNWTIGNETANVFAAENDFENSAMKNTSYFSHIRTLYHRGTVPLF